MGMAKIDPVVRKFWRKLGNQEESPHAGRVATILLEEIPKGAEVRGDNSHEYFAAAAVFAVGKMAMWSAIERERVIRYLAERRGITSQSVSAPFAKAYSTIRKDTRFSEMYVSFVCKKLEASNETKKFAQELAPRLVEPGSDIEVTAATAIFIVSVDSHYSLNDIAHAANATRRGLHLRIEKNEATIEKFITEKQKEVVEAPE